MYHHCSRGKVILFGVTSKLRTKSSIPVIQIGSGLGKSLTTPIVGNIRESWRQGSALGRHARVSKRHSVRAGVRGALFEEGAQPR